MMKSKALKICLCALLLLVCLTVTPTAVRAEDHSALHQKRAAVNPSDDMRSEARDGEAVYTNPRHELPHCHFGQTEFTDKHR